MKKLGALVGGAAVLAGLAGCGSGGASFDATYRMALSATSSVQIEYKGHCGAASNGGGSVEGTITENPFTSQYSLPVTLTVSFYDANGHLEEIQEPTNRLSATDNYPATLSRPSQTVDFSTVGLLPSAPKSCHVTIAYRE